MCGRQVDAGVMDLRTPPQFVRGNRAERESESAFSFASRLAANDAAMALMAGLQRFGHFGVGFAVTPRTKRP